LRLDHTEYYPILLVLLLSADLASKLSALINEEGIVGVDVVRNRSTP
jgi:hypothetical protein